MATRLCQRVAGILLAGAVAVGGVACQRAATLADDVARLAGVGSDDASRISSGLERLGARYGDDAGDLLVYVGPPQRPAIVQRALDTLQARTQVAADFLERFTQGAACDVMDSLLAGEEPDPSAITARQLAGTAIDAADRLFLVLSVGEIARDLADTGDVTTTRYRVQLLIRCATA